MTTWTGTLDRILADARKVSFGRVAATVVAAPFFAIAWLVGVALAALAVLGTACRIGFMAGRAQVNRRLPEE